MTNPDYRMAAMVDGEDQVLAITPTIDTDFRGSMFDWLDSIQLIRAVVVRGGNFFGTQHLPDGRQYSELKVASEALAIQRLSIMSIAQHGAQVLRDREKTVDLSRYIVTRGISRLFEDR